MSEQMDPRVKGYVAEAPDATQFVPPTLFGKVESVGGLMWAEAQPTDWLDGLRAAARFLKWCEANGKDITLAQEWALSEVRKL